MEVIIRQQLNVLLNPTKDIWYAFLCLYRTLSFIGGPFVRENALESCHYYYFISLPQAKGCNSKNVAESVNLWPHLGDGVSAQLGPRVKLFEPFSSLKALTLGSS